LDCNIKVGRRKVSLPVIQDIAKLHLLGGSLVDAEFSSAFPKYNGICHIVDVGCPLRLDDPPDADLSRYLKTPRYNGSLLAACAHGVLHFNAANSCVTYDKVSADSCGDCSVRDISAGIQEIKLDDGENCVVSKGLEKLLDVSIQRIRRSYRPDAEPVGVGTEFNFQVRYQNHRVRVRNPHYDIGVVDLDRVATIQLIGSSVRNIYICLIWAQTMKAILAFAFLDMNDNLHQKLLAEAVIPIRG